MGMKGDGWDTCYVTGNSGYPRFRISAVLLQCDEEHQWTYPQPLQVLPRMTSELRAQFPLTHASTVPIPLASFPF
jgi:hypothetical protein